MAVPGLGVLGVMRSGIDHRRHDLRGADVPLRVANLQIAVLIDGAAHLVGLDLVRVDRVGTNLLRGDAVSLHGVRHRGGRRIGNDDRTARRRINHSLVTASFDADMVGSREPHGKRHRQRRGSRR